MEDFLKRTWAQINLDAVEHNFFEIKKHLNKKTKLMCVLKADAYGHGANFLVKEYEKLGADFFGVSNIDEAIELRQNGATKPILIFGYTPTQLVGSLYKYDISQAVFSYDYAIKLAQMCKLKKLKLKIHIKIDTGMSRIGFFSQTPEFTEKSINQICEICNLQEFESEGIFTHFSVADDSLNQKEYTLKQFCAFNSIIQKIENLGIEIPIKHCCNSGGIVNFPEMHMDMVRAGILLYGLFPSEETKNKIDLKPVMELKTVVSQVKTIPTNTSVSYGRTFISKKSMTIASVPLGYADGYSLKFSGNAQMLIHGKRVPVVGRVCMDQLMLDVSKIEKVEEGCEITVFGGNDPKSISVDELARKIGTINYEIICLIGKRVPRVYYKNGKIVGKKSYI